MAKRSSHHGAIFFAAFIIATAIAAVIFFLAGGRWFTVITPSMATYAPVGTFVVSSAVLLSSLKVGDTILFHPPGMAGSTYFHRVVSLGDGVVKTQGDLSRSADPWTIAQTNLIGREMLHVVNLGWIIQALPFLVIGTAVLIILLERYVSARQRIPAAILGASTILATATILVKPFVRAVMIDQSVSQDKATFDFVPTGVFNVAATSHAGSVTRAPGELGRVVVAAVDGKLQNSIQIMPALSMQQLAVVIAICATPIVLTVVWLWASGRFAKKVDQAAERGAAHEQQQSAP